MPHAEQALRMEFSLYIKALKVIFLSAYSLTVLRTIA